MNIRYQRAMYLAKAIPKRKNKRLAIRKLLVAIKEMIGG